MSVLDHIPKHRISKRYILPAIALLTMTVLVGGWLLMQSPTAETNRSHLQQTERLQKATGLLDGEWQYFPGGTMQRDGLHITATGSAIVEQDGSGGQSNPPINIYGTHLVRAGDFALNATIRQRHGSATLQLYGQVPIIADEFRIERKSLRLTIDDTYVRADVWNGDDQGPSDTQTWDVSIGPSADVSVARQADMFTISLAGKKLGAIGDDHHIFSNGDVWFGMDAAQSWVLAQLKATPLHGAVLETADSTTQTVPAVSDGLQQLASKRRSGFIVGAAMALGPALSDPAYARIAFGGNFGALTTENALKWQFVHPQPDLYTFQEGDALVALAQRSGMAVHGHTLVFGEANPRWVQDLPTRTDSDKAKVKQVMLDHINTVMGHYKGKIASWDVVNEPLADYDTFDPDNGYVLRRHKWYQAMGQSYIATAFTAAHAADPQAKLFMNEYGLEQDGDRWDAFLQLVTKLKRDSVPIDGVGFQSHVYEAADKINGTVLARHMKQLAAIGLLARVSENDVYSDDGSDIQAAQYGSTFQTCLNQDNCIGYTTWGVSDRYDTFKDDDGSIQYGQDFLWDAEMRPTPAVAKLQSILR